MSRAHHQLLYQLYCKGSIRSIKQVRRVERDVSDTEIAAAALQYVRKISGYRVPSRANAAAFDTAVAEVAAAT
ncbi:DUF2277 domain-containing protein [Candidatus Gracilibacteria bacterium]|nr:DUF2277 domain-containing protein [Candidatus Gracilibacteria bacterium]